MVLDERRRNLAFAAIENMSRLTSVSDIASTFADAMHDFGFIAVGINGLPPPSEGADPLILTEWTPKGFRDQYIDERFYLVDHICARARIWCEPFRYDEAPFDRAESRAHRRFLEALTSFGMGKGLIVPIGRPKSMPACVWLAGENPDLDDDSSLAAQLIALFTASRAHALSPGPAVRAANPLSQREREVLRWISVGKTSWEVGMIFGTSERAVNKLIADAMVKLNAVSRVQAVVNAIRAGEIEL
jgi:DNA-binding CsgD family transcriptional regulator